MKTLLVLPILFLITGMANGQSFDLKQYHWKNRVLLVFAPDQNHGQYRQQIKSATEARAEYLERDLVVVSVFAESGTDEKNSIFSKAETRRLRTGFQVSDNQFCVILVGKDGGEKLRTTEVLLPPRLFGVIDAMPMRQSEAGRKNE